MSLHQYCILPNTPVRGAIQRINETGKKVVMVVNECKELMGIFSDGDMRRYILQNGDFDEPIQCAMNKNPVVFYNRMEISEYMKDNSLVVYPIVDSEHHLLDVVFWNDEDVKYNPKPIKDDVPVVIMAGGKGTRLYPYTRILPKPLIPIGDFTISEHIIKNFQKNDCSDFYFIVNYKKSMIKAYFDEIDKDYMVHFVDETVFLGTGGGLSLLKGKISTTFFLSNCDILINEDYSCIYDFHKEQKNKITFVCAMKQMTIPYGIITLDECGKIKEMTEKPSLSFLTNTGFYLIEPEVINALEDNVFIDLPDIAKLLIKKGERVGVYPISEKAWMDMGQFKEMEQMLNVLENQ